MNGIIENLEERKYNILNNTFQHPRVRYAACNAVGQMSTDFAPTFEKKFHETVIPGLLMVLDDNANPRVQAHAGAALVNFSEDCPKNILTPYLDAIMAKLESILTAKFQELLEKGTKLVLEQVNFHEIDAIENISLFSHKKVEVCCLDKYDLIYLFI